VVSKKNNNEQEAAQSLRRLEIAKEFYSNTVEDLRQKSEELAVARNRGYFTRARGGGHQYHRPHHSPPPPSTKQLNSNDSVTKPSSQMSGLKTSFDLKNSGGELTSGVSLFFPEPRVSSDQLIKHHQVNSPPVQTHVVYTSAAAAEQSPKAATAARSPYNRPARSPLTQRRRSSPVPAQAPAARTLSRSPSPRSSANKKLPEGVSPAFLLKQQVRLRAQLVALKNKRVLGVVSG